MLFSSGILEKNKSLFENGERRVNEQHYCIPCTGCDKQYNSSSVYVGNSKDMFKNISPLSWER